MENKNVGYLILGISAVMIFIILLFNQSIKELTGDCPLLREGYYCPAHEALPKQLYLSLAVVGLLIIIGLFLIFSKPTEKIVIKKVMERKEKRKMDLSYLNKEEREVLHIISGEKAVFQSELIEKTKFGKAKITRILDRLEGHRIIERKRRGMNNIVVLKE